MTAAARGRPIPHPLDHRADIFALGTVLLEALGVPLPFVPAKLQALCRQNPLIGSGLADVLARCLAPDASDRYPDAALLADDLRRHLTNRPLVGVRNRNVAERVRKWYRRRPQALLVSLLLTLCLGVVLALTVDAEWSLWVIGAGMCVALLGYAMPRVYVNFRARRRGREIERGLPVAVDLLGLCLTSGQNNLAAAIRAELVLHPRRTTLPHGIQEIIIRVENLVA